MIESLATQRVQKKKKLMVYPLMKLNTNVSIGKYDTVKKCTDTRYHVKAPIKGVKKHLYYIR